MRPRPPIALLLLCLVVVLAGCTALFGDSTEETLEERLTESEPPEYVHSTMEITVPIDNVSDTELDELGEDSDTEEVSITQEVWYRDDGTQRIEAELDSSMWITVNDGEYVWDYVIDGDENEDEQVTVRTTAQLDDGLEQLYEMRDEMFDVFEITDVHETTLDGHDVYHVAFEAPEENADVDQSALDTLREPFTPGESDTEPEDGEPSELDWFGDAPESAEFWLEDEHLFPVRLVLEEEVGTVELSHTDLAFDELPDETFEFDPPENVTVEEVEIPEVSQYDSVGDVDEAVDLSVEEPPVLPEGYELEDISVREYEQDDRTVVSMVYMTSDDSFASVQIADRSDDHYFGDGEEEVSVDGRPGIYVELEEANRQGLWWECPESEQFVDFPDDVDRETVFDVAESLGCP